MPWIIDYELVLEEMTAKGFKCNYYNSGAFGFRDAARVKVLAWIGPEDSTIREAARPFVRPVAPPFEPTLAKLCRKMWLDHFPGRAWVMPMSHWAYELDFGSPQWMPAIIENVGLDSGMLQRRNNAAAIEFSPQDADRFEHFIQRLLEMLLGSDFAIAFPGHPVLCTVHHHKQLWWQTTEPAIFVALENATLTAK